MAAISRNKVKIYMTAAGVNPSAVAASDLIAGEIKSYSKSGGERDVETDPVFGGYVDKEKPITEFEISMEVVPSIGTGSTPSRWDAIAYALNSTSGTPVYTTKNVELTDRAIFIEAVDGTSYKSWAFNNCNVTTFDLEHNADDNQTGTVNFKFSPTTSAGAPNFQTAATQVTSLIAWATLATS